MSDLKDILARQEKKGHCVWSRKWTTIRQQIDDDRQRFLDEKVTPRYVILGRDEFEILLRFIISQVGFFHCPLVYDNMFIILIPTESYVAVVPGVEMYWKNLIDIEVSDFGRKTRH